MKRYIKNILIIAFLVLASFNESKAQVSNYSIIDVYNSHGLNASDFVLSYDINNTCRNNIKVINNLNYSTIFNFEIRINNVWQYTGRVNIPANRSVYFNDAFINCGSSRGIISVRCW